MKRFLWLLLFVLVSSGCETPSTYTNINQTYATYSSSIIDPNLLEAIYKLDIEGVRSALQAGANPNAVYSHPFGLTAINIAGGCEPSTLYGTNELSHENAEKRILSILKLLFNAGAKIQQRDKTILHSPAIEGYPSVVEFLLKKGANPNGKDRNGFTPIILAVRYEHSQVIDILLKHGAFPLSAKDIAQIRFVKAARDGDISKMGEALEQGASVNSAPSGGNLALHQAVLQGHCEAVSFLLSKGANPNITQETFWVNGTALHCAVYACNPLGPTTHPLYSRLPMVRTLLEAGAHVSAHNKDGQTPLHLAAKYNILEAAKMLIEGGAKLMPKDNEGKTPLDYAESGEMIKLLKSHGAKEQ